MPNLKSAKKRLRKSQRAEARNMPVKSEVRTRRRQFMEAAAGGDKEAADQAYRTYCSALDKAAKIDVIKKNTAVRRKARAANRLRELAGSEAPSA